MILYTGCGIYNKYRVSQKCSIELQKVEECDATGDHSSTVAGYIIIAVFLQYERLERDNIRR